MVALTSKCCLIWSPQSNSQASSPCMPKVGVVVPGGRFLSCPDRPPISMQACFYSSAEKEREAEGHTVCGKVTRDSLRAEPRNMVSKTVTWSDFF